MAADLAMKAEPHVSSVSYQPSAGKDALFKELLDNVRKFEQSYNGRQEG